jgi:N-methylhydantoinase A/oxoprolinase/acetone carboxylase beta subunit
MVEAGLDPTPGELRGRFEAEHEARYGFRDVDAEVELVTVRVSVFGAEPELELRGGRERREVSGVLALAQTTVLVPEHWRGEIDADGTVRLWTR